MPSATTRSLSTCSSSACRRAANSTIICTAPSLPRPYIRDAVEDELCVNEAAHAFAKPQAVGEGGPVCGEGAVPAANVYKDLRLYDGLIDAFSMRGFVPAEGVTGHDHFFDAFTKFGGLDPSHTGEWLDELAGRAASQNTQYLELMATPTWHRLDDITKDVTYGART